MPTIETRDGTEIYYKDWGSGRPVVLIHGWPLHADMWEYQMTAMAAQGLRCIAPDRRGFGRSAHPWSGYDYDTLADDVATLIDSLDLRDIVLVGFSMGGGEVARYLSRHGSTRIARAVLVGSVLPFLLKTRDNPGGVEPATFDGIRASITADREQFFADSGKAFAGANRPGSKVSDGALHWTWLMAMQASLKATLDCVHAFSETDFRQDAKSFTIPTLIVHGDDDQIVPFEVSRTVTAKLIPAARLSVYQGAPHGLYLTHKDRLNSELLAFAGE